MRKSLFLFFILSSCITKQTLKFPLYIDSPTDELNQQISSLCRFNNCDHIIKYLNQSHDFRLRYELFVNRYQNTVLITIE
jgi:hypothetical protein